jgi:trk system potassium uptake protein
VHGVTVIDWEPSAFYRLGKEYAGNTHLGNGIDVDVLRAAGVREADAFIALTNGDNSNLMAGQIAQFLGVKRVIVRVYDDMRCEIFADMGMKTVSPTVQASTRLLRIVTTPMLGES